MYHMGLPPARSSARFGMIEPVPRRLPSLWLVDVIHRLQCERGASCAMVASGGKTDELWCGGGSLVASLRANTDLAIGAGAHFETLASMREKLDARLHAQRRAVDDATARRDALAFYTSLSSYTECVAMLLARIGDAARTAGAGSPRQHDSGAVPISEQPPAVRALVSFSLLKEAVAWERGFLAGEPATHCTIHATAARSTPCGQFTLPALLCNHRCPRAAAAAAGRAATARLRRHGALPGPAARLCGAPRGRDAAPASRAGPPRVHARQPRDGRGAGARPARAAPTRTPSHTRGVACVCTVRAWLSGTLAPWPEAATRDASHVRASMCGAGAARRDLRRRRRARQPGR